MSGDTFKNSNLYYIYLIIFKNLIISSKSSSKKFELRPILPASSLRNDKMTKLAMANWTLRIIATSNWVDTNENQS